MDVLEAAKGRLSWGRSAVSWLHLMWAIGPCGQWATAAAPVKPLSQARQKVA